MAFCPKCGARSEAADRFCQQCGTRLPEAAPAAEPTAAPVPPPATVPPPRASANAATSAGLAWLIARAKAIVLGPSAEWPVIAEEADQPKEVLTRYVLPLAAIGPVAGFIGMVVFGISLPFVGTVRIGVLSGLGAMVTQYVLGVLAVFLVAWIANALAPTFDGKQSFPQAVKLVAYAYTPAWLAGILGIVPVLGMLGLLAALYSLYVLYLGVPVMMRCPKEKALPYTVVLILVGLVAGIVLSFAGRMFMPTPSMGDSAQLDPSSTAGAVLGGLTGTTDTAEARKRLDAMAKSMEEASKKMEAAQKSGDPAAAAAAAGQTMGALMAGGAKAEAVDFQTLKALLPESLGSFRRNSASGERTAMGGMNVSVAEGDYDDGGAGSIRLKITDLGGAGLMLAGVAAWSMVEIDRESDNTRERSGKLDGRPFHERFNNRDRSGEFALVVGQRFMVEAQGHQVDLGTLKGAVTAVNLAKLESMKDTGKTN